MYGGEGGIRTLDTLQTYTHFPGVRLQPLGHFTVICYFEMLCGICYFVLSAHFCVRVTRKLSLSRPSGRWCIAPAFKPLVCQPLGHFTVICYFEMLCGICYFVLSAHFCVRVTRKLSLSRPSGRWCIAQRSNLWFVSQSATSP